MSSTSRQRQTAIVVCPRIEGHRLSYAKLLLQHAAATGRDAVLVGPRGISTAVEYRTHLAANTVPHDLRELPDLGPAAVQRLLDESKSASVVFPDGDDVVAAFASGLLHRGSNDVSILVMRPKGQQKSLAVRSAATAAKASVRWAARRRAGVTVMTLASAVAAHVSPFEVRDPIAFSPDPHLADAYRREWASSAAEGTRWLGVVGALTSRKNILVVSDALTRVPQPVGLVLAGHAEDGEAEVARWVAPLVAANIVVQRVAGTLSDEQLDSIISALDVAVVAHSNEGPSGIVGKAHAANRFVLAAGALSLKADIRANPALGLWTPLEPTAMARAAEALLSRKRCTGGGPYSSDFAARLLGEAV
ncbi:hypothetical protein ACLBWJ_11350 [Microbacterium sp. M4A5_1d]